MAQSFTICKLFPTLRGIVVLQLPRRLDLVDEDEYITWGFHARQDSKKHDTHISTMSMPVKKGVLNGESKSWCFGIHAKLGRPHKSFERAEIIANKLEDNYNSQLQYCHNGQSSTEQVRQQKPASLCYPAKHSISELQWGTLPNFFPDIRPPTYQH
jgi:hypothetical protein